MAALLTAQGRAHSKSLLTKFCTGFSDQFFLLSFFPPEDSRKKSRGNMTGEKVPLCHDWKSSSNYHLRSCPGLLRGRTGSEEQATAFWSTNIMPFTSPVSLQQITCKMMTTARKMSRTAGALLFLVQGRACLVTRRRGALCLRGLTTSAGKEQGWVFRKQANHAACEISSAMRRHCQLEGVCPCRR